MWVYSKSNISSPIRRTGKGNGMSTLEIELFNIVRKSAKPEQAVLTAIEVFTAFLAQLSEDQEQLAVCPLESF